MRASSGQALVELAVCLPVVMLLGLGAAGVVEVADAASGLRAATDAAVAVAARAPDQAQAEKAAGQRFAAVVAGYPLRSARLTLVDPSFARGSLIRASATASAGLGWETMSFLPASVQLSAAASMRVEPWRTQT
jgi:Flp pilus assembly protein TadG